MNQKSETESTDMKTLKRQINAKGIKSPIGLKKNPQMAIRQIIEFSHFLSLVRR